MSLPAQIQTRNPVLQTKKRKLLMALNLALRMTKYRKTPQYSDTQKTAVLKSP